MVFRDQTSNGRGAFCGRRSLIARTGGAHRRENAGMSSVMSVRTRHTESLRVPGQRQSSQGQSGPKPRTSRRRRWQAGWIVLHRSASFERGRDAVGKVNRSNGQDRLLARSASPRKSPVARSMTTGTSVRESAEVDFTPGRQEKLLARRSCARTANRHW